MGKVTFDMGNGITAGEAITILGFVIAVIWQSVTLKANLQLLIDRVAKIEADLHKITDIFINQAELRTNFDGLNARVKTMEDRCFTIQYHKIDAKARDDEIETQTQKPRHTGR